MKTEGGGATISDQTTTTTKREMIGHHGGLGGHGESKAVEELVPMRWRQGRRRGTRVGEVEVGVELHSGKDFLVMVGNK